MAIGNLVAFADTGRARTNIAAWNLINQVNSLNRELTLRQLRIATGQQQPRMEDGASFFAIWNKMKNQVRGKGMAIDNIGDAKDELSLAEAGLLQVDEMLGKMRDLAVRAANETLTEEQREDARQELLNLYITVANLVKRVRFNEGGEGADGLLDGFSHTYQVGPNETDLDRFTVEIPNILLGITQFFSPELGGKLTAMREVLLSLPEADRSAAAAEIRSYAQTLPEDGLRKILGSLATAFEQPDHFEAGFLTELARSGQKDLEGLDHYLETLFSPSLAAKRDALLALPAGVRQGLAVEVRAYAQTLPAGALRNTLVGLANAFERPDRFVGGFMTEVAKAGPQDLQGFDQYLETLFSPALGEKLESMRQVFLTLPEDTRGSIAAEVRNYAGTLSPGGIRDIVEALADACAQPDQFKIGLLADLAKSGAQNVGGLEQHLKTLIETRLNPVVAKARLGDFQTDGQIRQALQALAPLFAPLTTSPGTLNTVADTLENVASAPEVTHQGLAAALRGVSGAIREIRDGVPNAINSLESLIATKLNSPTQRLFLAQDIVFFASADPAVVAKPAVQNALNQLALDIVNEVPGLPNFKAAVNQLSDQDRAVFQAAVGKVATDSQNGLSFHVAVPDLDGTGGPFSTSANTFASFLVNIVEKLPDPEDRNDVNLAAVLRGVANTLDVQYPRIAGRLSTIATLLSDNDDTNDAALATALTALAQQIESDSGTSSFFTNPIDRNAIRNAFLAPTGSQAFANLSAPMRNAYLALTDGIAGLLDLNGAGAPLATTGNTFASLVLGITEKNPQIVPPEAQQDDVNMAALLQNVAGTLTAPLPEVASLVGNVVSLLTNETDADDAQLAEALKALGAKIEAVSGGQNVDGRARAELRRVLLEQTGSQAFSQLSLAGKAAFLTLAESLGAYTAQEITSLDAGLDAIAGALTGNTTKLQEKLTGLANQLADKTVSDEAREAVVDGFAQAAALLTGNDPKVLALKKAIDDPANNNQASPADLVGILARHIPDTVVTQYLSDFATAGAALQGLRGSLNGIVPSPIGSGWEEAIHDFLKFENNTDAGILIGDLDDAINFVKDRLIDLGGVQTKLTSLLDVLTASETAEDSVASRFGDADLAKEQVELAKLQLFSQLATAQAAAANTLPSQLIAGLFGGG